MKGAEFTRETGQALVWQAIREWWRTNLSRLGLLRTAQLFFREMWEFVRDATPARRKQRYGDIEFDCDYKVHTTAATVSLRTHLLGVLAGGPYQPCDPALFQETLSKLHIEYQQFDFIDLGSGKGRALLMASEYPFRRVLGVELIPEFHRLAEDNIRRFNSPSQRCFRVESQCGDARQFHFPPTPTVLFLFNPLPEPGLEAVISNLEHSLREHPRQFCVLYHNPVLEHVLARSPLLEQVESTLQFAVYRSRKPN